MIRARAVTLALFAAASLAARAGRAQRSVARVVDATRQQAWIDAGRDDGLREGARWQVAPGVELTVVAVTRRSAAITASRGSLPAVGQPVALPDERAAPPPPSPGPREAPRAPAPWDPSYAIGATPWLTAARGVPSESLGDPFDDDPRRRPQGLRGEVALRFLAGGSPGADTRGYQDLGLVSQVSAAWGGGWFHDHLVEARVVASPEVFYIPLQHPQARLDVYLLRFGYAPSGSAYGVEFGRMPTLPGMAVGMTDGARVRWRPTGSPVEVSAFAGLRPDVASTAPSLYAPRVGASVRARFGGLGPVRARLDAALVVDGWNTSLDRAFTTLGAGFEYRSLLSFTGEAVLDLAPDAAARDGVRVTRAILEGRADLLRGGLRVSASGGLDRPLYTSSLQAQIPGLPALPVRRFAALGVDGRAHARLWVFGAARASDDPDGLRSLVTEAGARLLDLPTRGSNASLMGRWSLGDRVNGYGAHAAWSVMLDPLTHIDAGYGLDRLTWGDNAITTWAHRARVAGDRRFGARWRAALSYEASWGAFALQHLVFLMVGYRLG